MNVLPSSCLFLHGLISEALFHRDTNPQQFFPGYERFQWVMNELWNLSMRSHYLDPQISLYGYIGTTEQNRRLYLDPSIPPTIQPHLALVFCIVCQATKIPVTKINLSGIRDALIVYKGKPVASLVFPRMQSGNYVSDEAKKIIANYFERGNVSNGGRSNWYVRLYPTHDAPIHVYTEDPDEDEDWNIRPLFTLPLSLFPELELRRVEEEEAPNDDGFTCGDLEAMPEVDTAERSNTPPSPPRNMTSYWLLDVKRVSADQ